MAEKALELLGTENPDLFVECVSAKLESDAWKGFLKEMSILVHRCAEAGDEVAAEILRTSGREYAACVMGVVRHLPRLAQNGKVELILVGSCFLRADSDLVRRTMEQVLVEKLPEVKFHVRPIRTEPAAGGLLWAREIAGIDDAEDEVIRESYAKARVIS